MDLQKVNCAEIQVIARMVISLASAFALSFSASVSPALASNPQTISQDLNQIKK